MRFTSLIVELVRARPRLIFWVAVLFQAALWFILPVLLYASPPGDLATVLAFGREYQLGTDLGPPLAFWLADIAFRLAGGHMFGVYLLSQICFAVTLWAVFTLGRAIVGGQQAVLAALLTATITAFSFPAVEFGPAVLACPLWALVLLHAWRVIGQRQHAAWFALSIEIGLLFLTTPVAIVLVLLLAAFALATAQGRRTLRSLNPLFEALVIGMLALPYLVWLLRSGTRLPLPVWGDPLMMLEGFGTLLAHLALGLAGIAILVVANWKGFDRKAKAEDAPVIFRPPVEPLARQFVCTFALAPALVLSLVSAWLGRDHVLGGEGVVLLMVGPAVVVAAGDLIHLRRQEVLRTIWLLAILAPVLLVLGTTFIQPWIGNAEVRTLLPASTMGRFFGDNYRLRTNAPLQAVAGDPQLAALVGIGAPTRPRVFFDAAPERTPWLTADKFAETGGLVVWRATDTVGAPPPELAARFPGLVPEVPRVFTPLVSGRQDALRIGWGVVRPKGMAQGGK
ncbi:MAG: glycosyltransferase family 39 protein [Afipia sp.]|nr:glycosyltransferase family 39 protein [Afipia sp.]